MDKYNRYWMIKEGIPNFTDKALLNLLLLEQRLSCAKQNSDIKFSDIDNLILLEILLTDFHNCSMDAQNYLKKTIFNKINKNFLYRFILSRTCNMITDLDFDFLDEMLNSSIKLNLFSGFNVSDDKKLIELLLDNNTKIRFSNIYKNKDHRDKANGECHNVTLETLIKFNGQCVMLSLC